MRWATLAVVGLLLAGAAALAQKPEEVEEKLLDQINAYRDKKKLPKLETDDELTAIAQEHAKGMAKADKYGDTGRDGHVWQGKGPAERVKAAGYKHLGLGENVGRNANQTDPVAVMMKTWLGSAPHFKNITTKEFTKTGIGAAKSKSGKWYFVQLYARPAEKPKVAKQTTYTVKLENRTKQTIAYRIEKSKFELESGKGVEVTHTTTARPQIAVTWPGAKKEELFDLADKGSYAFVEKDKDKYAFEKADAKAAKVTVAVTLENRTKQTIAFRMGAMKYKMDAGRKGQLTFTAAAPKGTIAVTWPGSEKEEPFEVVDKGEYAFVEKDKDKYALEKVEPK
jgi:hypothetical protein